MKASKVSSGFLCFSYYATSTHLLNILKDLSSFERDPLFNFIHEQYKSYIFVI